MTLFMLSSVEPVGQEVKAYERFHRTASHLPGLHSGSGGCKHVHVRSTSP